MEVAAFWIALAAVIGMGSWYKSRTEAQKHQTFRTIVEKTGTVDEAQLRLLLDPPNALERSLRLKVRGTSYRTLRVVGTIVMFIAVGLLFFAGLLMGMLQSYESTDPAARLAPSIAMAMSGFVFVIGAGLFFSSRFVERPAESDPRNGSPGE